MNLVKTVSLTGVVCLAFMVVSTSSLHAQSDVNEPLFTLTFEDGRIPDELETDGSWGIADEDNVKGLHVDTDKRASVYFTEGFGLRNYILEARLKVKSGSVYLQSRYIPSIYCHYYLFALNVDDGAVEIGNESARSCERQVWDSTDFEIDPDEWMVARLEVEGGTVRAFIEGNQVLSSSDQIIHQQGTFGLVAEPNSEVVVSEINVYPIGEEFESDAPPTLENYAESHEIAVQELKDFGLIPQSAERVFYEDYAYLSTIGAYGVYLKQAAIHENIVLAGEMSFSIGTTDEPEICGLMSRVEVSDSNSYGGVLYIVLVNDGSVLLGHYPMDSEEWVFAVQNEELNLEEPHHLLLIVEGDQATVYVDGQLTFEGVTIFETQGINGIHITGRGVNPTCEARDVWAYQFDE